MNGMKILTFFSVVTLMFIACGEKNVNKENAEQVAATYCGACHRFPEASLLDSATWQRRVLPAMAGKLGLRYFNGEVYENVKSSMLKEDSTATPQIYLTPENWKLIENYYKEHSPKEMPAQDRAPIEEFTDLFNVKAAPQESGTFPTTTFLKIDTTGRRIIAAQGFDSTLLIYDRNLKLINRRVERGIIVDASWNENPVSHELQGMLVNIGNINPNDERLGFLRSFTISGKNKIDLGDIFLDSLPRPVQVIEQDLDGDGRKDWLICGFGNQRGELFWLKNEDDGKFSKKTLLNMPGAIRAVIRDENADGLPDIWVLMAQAEEGLYLFTNLGNGKFKHEELIRFPPVFGSSYFELDDFNNDGHPDILYTCGDNADITAGILKPFHGLYIYLNDGSNHFSQKWFFPIHGSYKALARDFDLDGDLDIAAISYFPDSKNQPQEGFVYLENRGNWNFKPFTIQQFDMGKWITMDAGDVDGDGDVDIVIGSLAVRNGQGRAVKDTSWKFTSPFLLLENQLRKKK